MKKVHLHLVSDATGDTARSIARACLVQFENVEFTEHFWVLVRTEAQMERVIDGIATNPGIVICTVLSEELRTLLEQACRGMNQPFIPVLDPVLGALATVVGTPILRRPGWSRLDASYFDRIDAMQFVTAHDDGQSTWNLNEADVVLVGVSRTSKTPTCVYLANRGIKAANVPYVPGIPLPPELMRLEGPTVVGLTIDAVRLVQVRRNRLLLLREDAETNYVDLDRVKQEIAEARRIFLSHRWPIIDVTRRSIEETAAAIIQLLANRQQEVVRT